MLSKILVFSTSFIFLNYLISFPAHPTLLKDFFNFISTISYGYIVSYLFYLINIQLPKIEEIKKRSITAADALYRVKIGAEVYINTLENFPETNIHFHRSNLDSYTLHYFNIACDNITELDIKNSLRQEFMQFSMSLSSDIQAYPSRSSFIAHGRTIKKYIDSFFEKLKKSSQSNSIVAIHMSEEFQYLKRTKTYSTPSSCRPLP